jgi:hypothetical protein
VFLKPALNCLRQSFWGLSCTLQTVNAFAQTGSIKIILLKFKKRIFANINQSPFWFHLNFQKSIKLKLSTIINLDSYTTAVLQLTSKDIIDAIVRHIKNEREKRLNKGTTFLGMGAINGKFHKRTKFVF